MLIKKLQQRPLEEHFSVRKYLSSHVDKEYSYISKQFAQKEGLTIEQYFVLLKIEKVKELITYGEVSLIEIAKSLGYCIVKHLSTQFRKVLGVSTNEFKKSYLIDRKSIDQVNNNTIEQMATKVQTSPEV